MRTKKIDTPPVPLCKAQHLAAPQIAAGWVKIPLTSVVIDNRGTFNPSLNRYSIPEAGFYNVFGKTYGQMYLNPSAWSMVAGIYKNGSLISTGEQQGGYPAGAGGVYNMTCVVQDLLYLKEGDYLELWVSCSNASTIISGSADPLWGSFMTVQKVG
jgi:hypothetical protein